MARAYVKSFSAADERRLFAGHGYIDLVDLGGRSVGLSTFEPGWRWSKDVKPIAGTEQCMAEHSLYVLSGRMQVQLADGQSFEVKEGDVATVPPGHDAWVLGSEACRAIDFGGIAQYAKRAAQPPMQTAQPEMAGTSANI